MVLFCLPFSSLISLNYITHLSFFTEFIDHTQTYHLSLDDISLAQFWVLGLFFLFFAEEDLGSFIIRLARREEIEAVVLIYRTRLAVGPNLNYLSAAAQSGDAVPQPTASKPMVIQIGWLTRKAYHEGTWKIPLDTSTRWSGNYQMLDIVYKASKSMDAVIRKYETLGSRMLLTAVEKNAVNMCINIYQPFYKTIKNMCTNKVPTAGLVLFFMDHISETIAACRDSHLYPELKNAIEDMAKKVRNYNSQICNIFTYMTAILDPRIKGELIPGCLNSDNFLEEARTHFIRNYSINHFPSMAGGYSNQDIEEGGNVSFAEEIARKKRRANTNNSSDELTQYLSEPPAPLATDVLEWWKVNSMRYPRLSIMARDFLAVQANSVAPEELFCGKGAEMDKQRFCMPHDSTQALLCIRSWLQSGMKLKCRTAEIDFERLMELASSADNHNSSTGSEKKQRQ